MSEANHEARELFATITLEMLNEKTQMLNDFIFSDEAHFMLKSHTNTQRAVETSITLII